MIVDDSRLIFVGGSPRSGTTLANRMICSLEGVFGGPEFDLMPQIMQLHKSGKEKISSGRISEFLNSDDLDNSVRNLVFDMFRPYFSRNSESTFLSEKTPSNILFFNEMIQLFPKSIFVFVIRNPLSVVSSMLEVGKRIKRDGSQPPTFCKSTKSAMDECLSHISGGVKSLNSFPDKVIILRYDDLLENWENALDDLISKIGLDVKMGDYSPNIGLQYELPPSTSQWETGLTKLDKSRKLRWKKNLNIIQIGAIKWHFRDSSFAKEWWPDKPGLLGRIFFRFSHILVSYKSLPSRTIDHIRWLRRKR